MHCMFIILVIFSDFVTKTLSNEILNRTKRWLIYPYGGQAKVVIGIAYPIPLGIKQYMSVSISLQFEFLEPTNITQIQNYPPIYSTRSREKRSEIKRLSDRNMAYLKMEEILNSHGMNGHHCLLRSICENAMDPVEHDGNGILGELLHIFLSPNYGDGEVEEDLDSAYADAQAAGNYGVDCFSMYPECPYGSSILDFVSVFSYE